MIKTLVMIFLYAAFVSQTCSSNISTNNFTDSSVSNKKGFAIVELFTSEGCSSCPPADKLASEIAMKAEKDNSNIFVLSEHVDYWNNIGWADPFSNAFYSQRQRGYADLFKNEGVYTPQMIVNGKISFVGSDKTRAAESIGEALSFTSLSKRINISGYKITSGNYHYKLDVISKDDLLNFVLVEKYVESNVLRGENSGRILSHRNVVREWVTVDEPLLEGNIQFKNSFDFRENRFEVFAFIQNRNNKEITSAGALGR